MIQISLSTSVYINFPLAEALRRISQAGYTGVDIWGGRPHAYRYDLSQAEITALRNLLRDLNLGVASFIPAQFRYPTCLCSGNETIRRESVAYIKDSIRTASALGAPVISVCPGHSLFSQTKKDAWQRLRDSLDEICRFAADYVMQVAIEAADHYETDLIQTTEDAARMITELGHKNFGFVLDTGHAHILDEDIRQAIITHRERLFHVHVDDNQGKRDQHLVPGEGTFDFPSFFDLLNEIGYQGYLGVELSWDYTPEPDPAVTRSIRYIRENLEEVNRR